MNLETMIFHQSSWPTIKNLSEINPRYLEMLETKFTNEDMNLFIRNWMNGGNSNLGTLIFRLKQLDVQIIMNEIPFVSRETPNDFIYNMPGRNKPHYFESIMEVRNVNGVVASIVAYIGVEKFYFSYMYGLTGKDNRILWNQLFNKLLF
uniref:FBA_2 domain-containing protein n=1 Tax=Caenorhabditis tropicalis TaxID=1561998 RepID=A0A1I7UMK0_9PELO